MQDPEGQWQGNVDDCCKPWEGGSGIPTLLG